MSFATECIVYRLVQLRFHRPFLAIYEQGQIFIYVEYDCVDLFECRHRNCWCCYCEYPTTSALSTQSQAKLSQQCGLGLYASGKELYEGKGGEVFTCKNTAPQL
jgi:hypothetical protein